MELYKVDLSLRFRHPHPSSMSPATEKLLSIRLASGPTLATISSLPPGQEYGFRIQLSRLRLGLDCGRSSPQAAMTCGRYQRLLRAADLKTNRPDEPVAKWDFAAGSGWNAGTPQFVKLW